MTIRATPAPRDRLAWTVVVREHRKETSCKVHAASAAQRAADRLLSLLESIPSHVLIVGTTTETDWTGGILLSRWSRMQLDKPPSAEIAALLERVAQAEGFSMPPDPAWAAKLVKYNGCNLRDQLNQLSDRLFDLTYETSAATAA